MPTRAAPARSSAGRSSARFTTRRSGEDRRDLVNVDPFFDAAQAVVRDGGRGGLETGGRDRREDREHQQRAKVMDRARQDLSRDLLQQPKHQPNATDLPADAGSEIGAALHGAEDPW